jgi:hypothetical protein
MSDAVFLCVTVTITGASLSLSMLGIIFALKEIAATINRRTIPRCTCGKPPISKAPHQEWCQLNAMK